MGTRSTKTPDIYRFLCLGRLRTGVCEHWGVLRVATKSSSASLVLHDAIPEMTFLMTDIQRPGVPLGVCPTAPPSEKRREPPKPDILYTPWTRFSGLPGCDSVDLLALSRRCGRSPNRFTGPHKKEPPSDPGPGNPSVRQSAIGLCMCCLVCMRVCVRFWTCSPLDCQASAYKIQNMKQSFETVFTKQCGCAQMFTLIQNMKQPFETVLTN